MSIPHPSSPRVASLARLVPWLLAACLGVEAEAAAHGGTYTRPPRPYGGPGDTRPTLGGGATGGSRGPGPAGPASPAAPGPALGPGLAPGGSPFGPMTGLADESADSAPWQTWWHFHHDTYLDLRARLQALTASSGANELLAERRRLAQELAPALIALMRAGDREVVVRQALIALARIAEETGTRAELRFFADLYLAGASPSLQEGALLALALAPDEESLELLRDVLLDREAGRARVNSPAGVPPRLRAFAAYALGTSGRDAPERTRRANAHALLLTLGQESAIERDLRVSCVLALGLAPVAPCRTNAEALDPTRQIDELHLCGGVQTEYLLGVVQDVTQDAWFRAHAATALGRLARQTGAGLAATEDHPAVLARDELLAALTAVLAETSEPRLRQGCLLAIGAVADADGDDVDTRARAALAVELERAEPLTQRLALLAYAALLGRPGEGRAPDAGWKEGSTTLLRQFTRARGAKAPWSALALGVAGHGRAQSRHTPPASFAEALRERLAATRSAPDAAALVLGLALLRDESELSAKALASSFTRLADPFFREQAAVAVGLCGASSARSALADVLAEPTTAPLGAAAAGLGLHLLGEPDLLAGLAQRLTTLAQSKSGEARRLVRTLALLQDPRLGVSLLALLQDTEREENLRATLTWALGRLADPNARDWSAAYANGIGYAALTMTLRSPIDDGRGLLDWR